MTFTKDSTNDSNSNSTILLVSVLTIPATVLITYRYFCILQMHQLTISKHVQQSLHSFDTCAFAVHVLAGLSMLIAIPVSAFYTLPRRQQLPMLFFRLVSWILILVNLSVFWLLPHPEKYKFYKVTSVRTMMQGLSILYVCALQFVAMALETLIFTTESRFLRILASLLGTTFFVITCILCLAELLDYPWETSTWAGRMLLHVLPKHLRTKSKLTQANVSAEPAARTTMFVIFLAAGVLSAAQSIFITISICRYQTPVPRSMEEFLIAFVTCQGLIMSAGFFTMTQTMFDQLQLQNQNDEKSKKKQENLKRRLLFEVITTFALPMGIIAVGPKWVGSSSFGEFFLSFLLWKV